jgi:RNA polymerase sigma-70 factor (ECF subfamily)
MAREQGGTVAVPGPGTNGGMPGPLMDDDTLAAAARAEPAAFAPLYERYVGAVYRYALRRLWQREAAEDATATVFTRALAALPRYRHRPGGSFRSWLFAIAQNVVIDAQRSARPTTPLDRDFPANPTTQPDATVAARMRREDLNRLLTHLNEDQGQVLELRLCGLSCPEAALLLGRSPTAVRSLQARGWPGCGDSWRNPRRSPTTMRRCSMQPIHDGRADALDAALDAALRGGTGWERDLEPETIAVLRRLAAAAPEPDPDPAFVARLRDRLVSAPTLVAVPRQAAWPMPSAPGAAGVWPRRLPSGAIPRPLASGVLAAALVVAVLAAVIATQRWIPAPHVAAPSNASPVAIRPSAEPVALQIANLDVEAAVEPAMRPAGATLQPLVSGPAVVAWRMDSAHPGDGGAVVIDGHLDHWTSGPAVFARLADISVGERIDVYAEDRSAYGYDVVDVRTLPIDTPLSDTLRENVRADIRSLVLITSAPPFDAERGKYRYATLVTAVQTDAYVPSVPILPAASECRAAPRSPENVEARLAAAEAGPPPPDPVLPTAAAGTRADAATLAVVDATLREYVACLNARDMLRAYALVTDAALVRDIFGLTDGARAAGIEWNSDVPWLATPAVLTPVGERVEVLTMNGVRVLDDGRVVARVAIGSEAGAIARSMHFQFVPGERYLVDAMVLLDDAE